MSTGKSSSGAIFFGCSYLGQAELDESHETQTRLLARRMSQDSMVCGEASAASSALTRMPKHIQPWRYALARCIILFLFYPHQCCAVHAGSVYGELDEGQGIMQREHCGDAAAKRIADEVDAIEIRRGEKKVFERVFANVSRKSIVGLQRSARIYPARIPATT